MRPRAVQFPAIPAIALATGCVAVALVPWLYADPVFHRSGLLVTFVATVAVPFGVAAVERFRGRLSFPVLLAVLSLPGLLIVLSAISRPAFHSPAWYLGWVPVGELYVLWFAPTLAVPLAYALGRAEDKAWQWRIAVPLFLLIVVGPVNFTLPSATPGVSRSLNLAILVVAVSTWFAISLYHLGAQLREWGEPGASPGLVPSVLAAVVCGWLLVGPLALPDPLLADPVATAVALGILWGPVVHLALRARGLGLHRRGAATGG